MSEIILQPSGQRVEAKPGETVLAALERAGYALDNNCRAGACGECKTKVLCGEFDQGMVLSMALSSAEREAGFGLMCMATPLSEELEIDYGTEDALPKLFPPRLDVPYVVTDRIQRTPTIVELRIRPTEGGPLRYWPGQYLTISPSDDPTAERCYSIANAPRPDGEISLLITRIEGGVTSGWIHEHAQVGSHLIASGPFGTFIGDPSTETPVVCLAAGSGLAPILALTDAALRRGFPHPVTLVFSARSADDMLAAGLFEWWSSVHPNFKSVVTYTGPEPTEGLKGRIPAVLGDIFTTLGGTSVFIAGSPEFVTDCEKAAKGLGARPDLIHTEGFTDQSVAAR
ncbi:MAG: 2Fe-2S iron-sulfur cluster-binding protein [Acidimicrobiales bacterium]|nr:2Fe-2S iron-sulfur cluster binding domain-containing protein [Acidimicrobiales bacterium]